MKINFNNLSNYLKNKIITLLVYNDNKYSSEKKSKTVNIKSTTTHHLFHWECSTTHGGKLINLLNYSLINKYWFQIVSLSIDSISGRLLSPIGLDGNSKYCLIKSENIIKYYDGYGFSENSIIQEYPNVKSIIYRLNLNDSYMAHDILNTDDKFINFLSSHFTSISKFQILIEVSTKVLQMVYNILQKNKINTDLINLIQINYIIEPIYQSNINLPISTLDQILESLPSKHVRINKFKFKNGEPYPTYFISLNGICKNNKLKSLTIENLNYNIEPYSFGNLNESLPNLKNLKLKLHFHQLILYLLIESNDSEFNATCLKNKILLQQDFHSIKFGLCNNDLKLGDIGQSRKKTIVEDFLQMCFSISSCKQLKSFTLSENCKSKSPLLNLFEFYVNNNNETTTTTASTTTSIGYKEFEFDDYDKFWENQYKINLDLKKKLKYNMEYSKIISSKLKLPSCWTFPLKLIIENTNSIEIMELIGMKGLINIDILSSFKINKSIIKLSFNQSSLDLKCIKYLLIDVLSVNKTIKYLDISNISEIINNEEEENDDDDGLIITDLLNVYKHLSNLIQLKYTYLNEIKVWCGSSSCY